MQPQHVVVRFCRFTAVAGCIVLSLALSACGPGAKPGAKRHPVYPVQGQVFLNGKPATSVYVQFVADPPLPQLAEERGHMVSQGVVDDTGTYKIETYTSADGAPAAKYKIRIKAPLKSGLGGGNQDEIDQLDGEYWNADENVKNDPTHFSIEVVASEGANPAPTEVPRLDLQIEGLEFQGMTPRTQPAAAK